MGRQSEADVCKSKYEFMQGSRRGIGHGAAVCTEHSGESLVAGHRTGSVFFNTLLVTDLIRVNESHLDHGVVE